MPFTGVVGALFSGIGGAIQSSQPPVLVSPNPNLLELREGREVRLLVPTTEPAPHVDACTITAPSGADIEAHALPQLSATEERYGSDRYYAFGRFQATESGDYVIDCSASEGVVAASVERTSPWIMPLIWLGVAVIGILLGATLMIIGITRLVRVGSHNRAAKRAANPGFDNPTAAGAESPSHDPETAARKDATSPTGAPSRNSAPAAASAPNRRERAENTAIALGPARTEPTQQRDASIPNPAPNAQPPREVPNPAPDAAQAEEHVKNPLGEDAVDPGEERPEQERPADEEATDKP